MEVPCLFFHLQQQVNFDLTDIVGLYTGLGIRNVGLIMEDYYQHVGYDVDQSHLKQGLDDVAAGRMQPLGEAFADVRKQYGIPKTE